MNVVDLYIFFVPSFIILLRIPAIVSKIYFDDVTENIKAEPYTFRI
jgi:hypothetical protein